MVGEAGNVVKLRNIAVESLMRPKQSEEVCGWRVAYGASFPLPECCVEIITFAKDGALSHIGSLDDVVQMEEASCKLQV